MFSQADREKVETELAKAEAKTAAEFVVVVARSSSPTGLMFPFLWMLLAAFLWYISNEMPLMPEAWDQLGELSQDIVLVFLSAILAIFAMRSPRVRRVLTPNADERRAVDDQAELQFYRRKIAQTSGRAGVLLYLSLMERRAVILADTNAHQILDQKTLDQSLAVLLQQVGRGETVAGISKLLEEFGDRLSTVLPPPTVKKNELCNALIFL